MFSSGFPVSPASLSLRLPRLFGFPVSSASPRTGKLSAQLTDEVSFAFPPQGEGGPLAVDEVPERASAFPPQGEGGPPAVDEVPERSEVSP